jgi:hypothetical protein
MPRIKAKTKKKTPRNAVDLTARNNNARKRDIAVLVARVLELEGRVDALEPASSIPDEPPTPEP